MKFAKRKKALALTLATALIFTAFSGFAYQDGFGTVYYDSRKEIFNGVSYGEIIGSHSLNGLERAYMVEADLSTGQVMPFVFNGEVRGSYALSDMVKYTEEQGYKVLAAVNGDIYDMGTGTPKSHVIHQGNIVTSGYNPTDRIVTFDAEGKAAIKYPQLAYSLKGKIGYQQEVPVIPPVEGVSGAAIAGQTTPVSTPTTQIVNVEQDFNRNVDFFNVQYGAAKGLHLFNRHYSTSTRTSGNCIEVVIDCTGGYDAMQLKVGKTITGTVKSVGINTKNTAIGENQIVLSTVAGSASSATLSQMVVGSQIELTVNDTNGGMTSATEALGFYNMLVDNGNIVAAKEKAQPRSAIGIKADGTIVMYAVDGRQANHSSGLDYQDVAKHLKSMGCVFAVNMDGGGSTTFMSRLPGLETTAKVKNKPSGGTQRKVANGLLLVYKGSGSNTAKNLNVYPALTLAMPGADVQLNTHASNEYFESVQLPGTISYNIDAGNGTIGAGSLYTAGNTPGKVVITATSGELKGTTEVNITKEIAFATSVSKLSIEPSKTADINVSVKSGIIDVKSKDSLFKWSCDEKIGKIDQNGLFTAAGSNALTGNIYVEYENQKITIPVQVGQISIDFTDTIGHWAQKYIGSLAARGIVSGIGSNMYAPDSNITRAQFLTMLSKSINDLDVKTAKPSGMTDVAQEEWYYNYVNWGYESGIVSGVGDNKFAPNANITREQMAVMLCNFATYVNITLPQVKTGVTFTDSGAISSWSIDYVNTAVGAGILNGMPEGNFKPQGVTTRAESATAMYAFCNIKDGIAKTNGNASNDATAAK